MIKVIIVLYILLLMSTLLENPTISFILIALVILLSFFERNTNV